MWNHRPGGGGCWVGKTSTTTSGGGGEGFEGQEPVSEATLDARVEEEEEGEGGGRGRCFSFVGGMIR